MSAGSFSRTAAGNRAYRQQEGRIGNVPRPGNSMDTNLIVLLAASRQGFKYCTWFILPKMYRNTEDIKNSKSVGVSQVSQLVVMILLINDCYVMSLVVIISRMNFVLYRNTY